MNAAQLVEQGIAHHEAGRWHQAEVHYRRALEADAACADAWHQLGLLADLAGHPETAIQMIRRALALNPRQPVYLNNLGILYEQQHDYEQAAQCLQQAVQLRPNYPAAHHNLGEVRKAQGKLTEAIAQYRRALQEAPNFPAAWDSLLMVLNYDPATPAAAIVAEHRRWAEQLPYPVPRPHDNVPEPQRRLRIGYVSPDFRKHAVARFFEPILTHHDRRQFDVFLYAEVPGNDAVTQRFRELATGWRSTVRRSAAEVAEQIRADGIDILLDLAGHTRHNRLDVFTHRAAPIQATYLGYPNTSGMSVIDYRISDHVVDPPEVASGAPEQLIRLPASFVCFQPPAQAPVVTTPPRHQQGHITFGSHHPPIKLNPGVFALWRRVLQAIPDSRLLLLRSGLTAPIVDDLRRQICGSEIDASRLEFRAPTADESSYLALYQDIDVILDCFPFTGHTMTCEALWMGAPVVTLRGERPAGRLSASVLSAIGLGELIADTPEQYVAIAQELAGDLRYLERLRRELRSRLRVQLCDGPVFTCRLEMVYREMWQRWCQTVRPASVTASPSQRASELNEQGLAAALAGDPEASLWRLEPAAQLQPESSNILSNLANVLKRLGRQDEAVEVLQRARQLAPDDVGLASNLGEVYRDRGEYALALDCYRQVMDRVPLFSYVHSNYLVTLNYDPAHDAQAIFEEYRGWGERAARRQERGHANTPVPDRPLRIGYVSPDFRRDPTTWFFEPVLRHHDRERYPIYLYAEVARPDDVTQRLKGQAEAWRLTVGRSAAEVAEQIRADGIDILVDLGGHFTGARLDILAEQAAPVQVSYLGTPYTTGLPNVDYRITDSVLNPPGEPARFTEELVWLPESSFCFDPPPRVSAVQPPPVLTQGQITFGCNHHVQKLNDYGFALWRRVLDAVPRSRLLVFRSSHTPALWARLRQRLQAQGIDPARVHFRQPANEENAYLELYHEVDVVLDSVPYTGQTTTCEALWMGVPVVTLRGDRPCARGSASVLTQVGLTELIADAPEQFVAIAQSVAQDVPYLSRLRSELRQRVRDKLCNGTTYTRQLEAVYRDLWQRWCRQQRSASKPQPEPTAGELQQQALAVVQVADWPKALSLFQQAAHAAPEDPVILGNLGSLLRRLGRLDEAATMFERALQHLPDDPGRLSLLGDIERQRGNNSRGVAYYARAMAQTPPFSYAARNYLLALNYDPACSAQFIFEEHRRWGEQAAPRQPRTYANTPDPDRPLRIGYVSSELRRHPAARFLAPMLEHHDRRQFAVFLYAEVEQPDNVTRRWQQLADGWRSTVGRGAAEVAEQVRADGIDILIDLVGHFAGSRLDVLAEQAAPVQAAHLSYPNTTGLPTVDYWITDAVIVPPGEEQRATEEVVRMPGYYLGFEPPASAGPVGPLPALKRSGITFGCNHNEIKLHDALFALWRRVLDTVPNSRLLLFRSFRPVALMENLQRRMEAQGITADRIVFRQPAEEEDSYLNIYQEVDIALDTFPFSGHTTTCESLWMGVPVMTLRGDRPSARVSASVLTQAGLTDWIAETPEEYVAIARRMTEDLPQLERLRGEMRQQLTSRLCDGAAYTRRLEKVYRELWQRWCRQAPVAPTRRVSEEAAPRLPIGLVADPPATRMSVKELNQQGIAAARRGEMDQALILLEQAVRQQPDYVPALNNLGNALKFQGRLNEAVDVFQRALRVAPDDLELNSNLGEVYRQLCQYSQALACYRRVLPQSPLFSFVYSNYLLTFQYDPAIDPQTIFEEHQRWGQQAGPRKPRTYSNPPDPDRPLRIGYVSSEFRRHPAARFLVPIMQHHDAQQFRIYLYGEVPQPDAVTQKLQSHADVWRSTVGRKAAAIAEQVRADGIDILVDLVGHFAGGRLDILAEQAAPVQATYLSYPHSTGLPVIDYRLTDDVIDPPGEPVRATEQLLRLPGGFICFDPPATASAVQPPPVLTRGAITFGCNQHVQKLNDDLFAMWRQVLEAVPNSRLLIFRTWRKPPLIELLKRRMDAQGIDLARVCFEEPDEAHDAYLEYFHQVDIVLDTFPYSGHTTTCEALWMGAPVLTLRSDRPCGRVSASILTRLGMEEWIADTPAEYVATAKRLAQDVEGLKRQRHEIRPRMQATLGDGAAFTRRLENAFREMWRTWCASAGTAPTSRDRQGALPSALPGDRGSLRGSLEIIVPVRPGQADRFPVVASPGRIRTRLVECPDGNLSRLYRQAYLDSEADVVVFKHDDFEFRDWELFEAQLWPLLEQYPIIGVAGARWYDPRQGRPWWRQTDTPIRDDGINRGRVAHPVQGQAGFVPIVYGPPGPAVVVDGAALAVRRRWSTAGPLGEQSAERLADCWDLELGRHFYDLAFSFNASRALHEAGRGPACYVVAVDVIHLSPGPMGPDWHEAARRFVARYGQLPPLGERPSPAALQPTPPLTSAAAGESPNDRGVLLAQQGKPEEALACFARAIAARPDLPSAYVNRAHVLRGQQRLADAERDYMQAVCLDPSQADVHLHLGQLRRQQGRLLEAVVSLRHASRLDPTLADAHLAAGTVHLELGQAAEAVAAFRQGLQLRPTDAATHNDLGNALQLLGLYEEAAASYRQALQHNPNMGPACANLAHLLSEAGDTEAAHELYQRAYRLQPNPRLRVVGETVLPILCQSMEHLRTARQRFADRLERLLQEGIRVDPTHEQMPTHFYLAYHGLNDRDLHASVARLGDGPRRLKIQPNPARGKKIRIGFLSRYLCNHTIGQLNHGLLAHIDRAQFEVVVLGVGTKEDVLSRKIAREADRYVPVPAHIPSALPLIAEQRLDILYLPDLGMDGICYTLAFSRLAPVQCVTWGHPVTSGLPTIDYFLSSQDLEVEGSQDQYTERLVRLSRLGVVYARPQPPEQAADRARFGLPDPAHVYLCPQTLFKFHPEFDELLAQVLRQDPRGLLVLIEGRVPRWKELLLERFGRTMPDVLERVRFVPKLSHPEFLNLLRVADVMLDPIHFGGGNTSYEGFAFGVPIVTLPSQFLRARLTYAMYRQMGFLELVARDAADYVRMAVQLGTDAAYRRDISERLRTASAVLYDDVPIVRELEQCWREWVER